jgi:predicted Zn-dependent protease
MRIPAAILALALAGCGTTYNVPDAGPGQGASLPVRDGLGRSASDFRRVAARVEPAAEAFCREEEPGAPAAYCDFALVLEDDPRMPPNAFQTRSSKGRPVVVVSASLLGEMHSDDEIAYVLSHETAHHIARHLSKQAQSQVFGALILGGIAQAAAGPGGLSEQALQEAMDMGAFVGGRAWSQDYELEADWLGAFIAARAGYDPERGAAIFGRPALASSGGPVILSSHPASPQRTALAARAAAEIRRQQAAGLNPRPDYAARGLF